MEDDPQLEFISHKRPGGLYGSVHPSGWPWGQAEAQLAGLGRNRLWLMANFEAFHELTTGLVAGEEERAGRPRGCGSAI